MKLPLKQNKYITDYFLKDDSIKILIFSNLIVIIFAVIENWDLLLTMWIFWYQCVIIGIFNLIRILNLDDAPTEVLYNEIKSKIIKWIRTK